VSIVVCVIASYFHLYYYFMGFDSTGPFVLTMFRIITSDVPYFLNFYMIVVVATACALSVLSGGLNPEAGYGFARLIMAIWTLIQNTVSMNNTTHDHISDITEYPKHLQWMADIILTFYYVTVIIMMLNLLIAMISNTYDAYTSYSKAILQIAKYNIMNAMEWVMWPAELKENRAKYAQINEQTKLQTLKDKVRAKPAAASLSAKMRAVVQEPRGLASSSELPSSKGRARTDTLVEACAQADTEDRVQVKYLFEMQNVNMAWYGEAEGGGNTLTAEAGKIADAITVALGGQAAAASSKNANVSNRKTTLFIIDPQVDFHPGGTLAIGNAAADSERIGTQLYSLSIHSVYTIYTNQSVSLCYHQHHLQLT
jgi:hypothetical protein